MKLALFLIFLAPANIFGYVIQSILLFIFLLGHFFTKGINAGSFQMKPAYIWTLLCLFSILIGTSIGQDIALSSYLLFIFVFFSIILFPFDIKVPSISNLLLVIAYLILLSQVILAFRIEPFSDVLLNIYSNDAQLVKEYLQGTGTSQLSWSRFGGVFINPNQCAKAYTFVLGLHFSVSKHGSQTILHIFIICFIGLLLTGSRTGMGIAVLMMLFRTGVSLRRILILSIPLIIAFSIAVNMSLRFIDFDSLLVSITEKNNVIIEYISHINEVSIFALIFGIGDISRIEYDFGMRLNSFDSEFGYLLQGFGLMSIVIILALIWFSFRVIEGTRRVFLLNLLWLLSSTILVNIRFGFIYFICLSIIHIMQEQNKNLGN